MGIVVKQSFKNLITTYLGFVIGALNTLVLYVNFMSEAYFGLVSLIVSTGMILMPFMAFGVQNTLVKFYSAYSGKEQDRFLLWMLFLPMVVIIPGAAITYFFYEQIATFLSTKNEIVYDYVWYIFLIALSLAYFEVFFAWSKVQFKTIFGNFMKEVFHRLCISILLGLLAFEYITVDHFLQLLVGVYVARMVIMKGYAYRLRKPNLREMNSLFYFGTSHRKTQPIPNFSNVIKYSFLILIAGSVATLLIDIDKFMINKLAVIENVAFYAVAVYIATVIAVPARAMHQITYPMVAQFLNEKRFDEMQVLYKKSSITLFLVASLLFVLIVCNLESLYTLIKPEYRDGLYVVLLISVAKLMDNLIGVNNAIIFNSDYYRMVLSLGIVLIVVTIVLNLIFIPSFGINGAAIATCIASITYSVSKLLVVQSKFKMHPFSRNTLSALVLLVACTLAFYFWSFPVHPIVAIILKSICITVVFGVAVIVLRLSEDISMAFERFLTKRTK